MNGRHVPIHALFLVLVGCPHPAVVADWAAMPRLPSPEVSSYGRLIGEPTDGAVAAVLGTRRTDAYLDGVAAGLVLAALDGRPATTGWQVRDIAWRAGWPYERVSVRSFPTGVADPPPDTLAKWLGTLPDDQALGLVRARTPNEDMWLAVTSPTPRVDLGRLPRLADLGDTLQVRSIPSGTVDLVDPEGQRATRSLDTAATFTLGLAGEWLVVVSDATAPVARFPIYVDLPGAGEPVWAPTTAVMTGPSDVEREVAALLAQARRSYARAAVRRDPFLDAAAATLLRDPAAGLETEAAALGQGDATLGTLECSAATVADCLDQLLWDPDTRPTLLGDLWRTAGIAADLTRDRVRVRVVLAEG